MRPSTTAGYGSLSGVSHGAAACTRSFGSRTYMIFELSLIELLNRMLRSPYFSEKTSRFTMLPSGTPPLPV